MATEERSVCNSCTDAAVASAKRAGEEYENAEFIRTVTLEFGDSISHHSCDEEEDEEVNCYCGCRIGSGISPWGRSFGKVTTKGDVCDSCVEAVDEAAMLVGDQSDDIMYTYMLARTPGGDIFPHECEAEDDEETDCNCGCRRN